MFQLAYLFWKYEKNIYNTGKQKHILNQSGYLFFETPYRYNIG